MNRIRILKWGILAGCLVFAQMANALVNTNINGVDWTWTYEGDILPDNGSATPPWTVFDFGGSMSTDGNLLTIDSTGGARWMELSGISTNWNGAAPSTVEFRMRVTGQTGTYAVGALVGGSIHRSAMRFSTNEVFFLDGTSSSSTLDTTVFHVYRITIKEAPASMNTLLYIDNDPTPVLFNDGAGALNQIIFGAFSGDTAGSAEFDYIRWTNINAFPVPEPSSVVLGGLAALFFGRRFLRGR